MNPMETFAQLFELERGNAHWRFGDRFEICPLALRPRSLSARHGKQGQRPYFAAGKSEK